jgi:hypothetical protein
VQIVERFQRAWVVLGQRRAQRIAVLVAGPDQILMRTGQNLERLGTIGVTSDSAMVVSIGAHQVRQQFGAPASPSGNRREANRVPMSSVRWTP